MIFIHKWRTYRVAGQGRVIIQEQLHIKIVNKFVKVQNFESYCIHQSNYQGESIKMNGSVKCKSDSLNCFIVKEILKIF